MQTFLPYPEFDRSAAVLDSPRLGKQRVETLQILRALTFPNYGWAHHPAKVMWTGYVPALVSYGLAMVDEWTARGGADSTRSQIAEFAPEPVDPLRLPSWLGNETLHRSHQSNLIRKDSAFYGQRFPGVPDDLAYFWPGADPSATTPMIDAPGLVILRPQDDEQLAEWVESGGVTIGETSPRGGMGPKWLAQLEYFQSLPIGSRFAAVTASGAGLLLGELTGNVTPFRDHREVGLRRSARFAGELSRTDFRYPALLQNPQSIFEVSGLSAETA